jgi:hypothetical protein
VGDTERGHGRNGESANGRKGPVGRRSRRGREGFNIFGGIAPDLSRWRVVWPRRRYLGIPTLPREIRCLIASPHARLKSGAESIYQNG